MAEMNRIKGPAEDCAVLNLYQGALLDTGETSKLQRSGFQKKLEMQVAHDPLR